MPDDRAILLASRGSALALAQANAILAQCRAAFPRLQFELKIIKTSGDKLQTASLAREGQSLPKGLFTRELEVALLKHHADLAVHSLKDLPTELPAGLILGAVGKRADVRDVLICRAEQSRPGQGFKPNVTLKDLPKGATVATSSTRRKSLLLWHRPDFNVVEVRGNVATRLKKLADHPDWAATILAAAGLARLNFQIKDGRLLGEAVPDGMLATILEPDVMLPCVGQGAIGIETRANDERIAPICDQLNDHHTRQCVTAERAFLAEMGGGCQSPVAAYAEILGDQIRLRAISFRDPKNVRQGDSKAPLEAAEELGRRMAGKLST